MPKLSLRGGERAEFERPEEVADSEDWASDLLNAMLAMPEDLRTPLAKHLPPEIRDELIKRIREKYPEIAVIATLLCDSR